MTDTYLVQDPLEPGYWEQFNSVTVLRMHAMGILEHVRNEKVPGAIIHYYRKAD